MRRLGLIIFAAATCVLIQSATAQSSTRRLRSKASKTLHKAWLAEKLDLNTKAAAAAYDETIKKSTPNMPERWIAFVRLEELSRLGVLKPEPTSRPSKMPTAVRKALETLDSPLPYQSVLANPLLETKLPALRPATPLIQEWARKQIEPILEERLLQDYRERQRSSSTDRVRRRQAYDIMQCELQGKRTQADQLRFYNFPDWKAPEVSGTAEAILASAQERLTDWIDTEEVSWRRGYLRELQKGIEAQSKQGAAIAVKFLQRLPRYSERLLGEEEPEASPKPKDAPKPAEKK